MARFSYGGQALIEGVLMRGRNVIAVALRHPDGRIVWADEKLAVGFRATRWARLPFIRGLVVLYETLVVGTRWLVRSAGIAAIEDAEAPLPLATPAARPVVGPAAEAVVTRVGASPAATPVADVVAAASTDAAGAPGLAAALTGPIDASGAAPAPVRPAAAPVAETAEAVLPVHGAELSKGAVALMLGLTLVVGVGLFFFLPLLLAKAIAGGQNSFVERVVEGVIQVAIFLGYLLLVGRASDVRRTFQYHGAEHMSIHALEAGDPLTLEAVRKYPTAHPRCGTEFLVVVILVSIIVFSLVGRQALPVMISSRIVLIPVIAGISYELLRFGARHRESRIVRWLFEPGIWVQLITTKQPTDPMIEVAIVSLEQALMADGEQLPEGAGRIGRSPLVRSAGAFPAAEA
jgi:uncharacterized protein YqhQ